MHEAELFKKYYPLTSLVCLYSVIEWDYFKLHSCMYL